MVRSTAAGRRFWVWPAPRSSHEAQKSAPPVWPTRKQVHNYESRVVTTPAVCRHFRLALSGGQWALSIQSDTHQQAKLSGAPLARRIREADGDALPSNDPMRISLVSPGFPPQLGGVEVVAGYLADELSGYGHQVTVYTQRPRGSTFPAGQNYPVRWFADWSGSRQFQVAPGLVRALWRDRGLFDVIHAHSFHAAPAMMAATVPKVPLVFTPHFHAVGHTRAASTVHTVYDPLATLLFRRAAKVTCVSVAESELLLRRYPFVEPRLSIVPLGVDTQALLAAEPIEIDRPIVLVAGRLEPYKRVDTAIRAFARMRNDAQLVVCGTGSHRPALERLARELGIAARVCFRGRVSDEELRRWQRTATSTLNLSAREAFGLVLLEAAVAGSRVLASDIPAHAELAQHVGRGDGRIAVVAPDVAAVAAALDSQVEMGRLTTPPEDRSFDWSTMARRFEAIYRSVS
jgi:glycosyltransferase involved in cell wall biosynthesis